MRHVFRSLLVAALLAAGTPVLAQPASPDAELQVQMAEARRQFDALEYEQAVPTLDRAIAALRTRQAPDSRRLLAGALELRARSRFGLGDQDGARQDFVELLKAEPGYTLTGQISPRVVTLFEEAQKATVTRVALNVTPASATVLLDGAAVPATGTIPVVIGDHTLTATRTGYAPGSTTFTAAAETTAEATLALTRSSAVLSIVTAPADVEVFVDGISRGKTTAGPPPAEFAERATKGGIAANQLSGVLMLTDVAAGSHRIEFRRSCYVQAERRQEITQLDDYVLDPVKLDPAVTALTVNAPQAGVSVFVDGESRGRTPYTTEVCEGAHTVELRSPAGRFVRRVDARPGQKLDVSGTLRPAFALVSSTQTTLSADFRAAIERALAPLQTILVFAPPSADLDTALKAEKLPADWLGYDANRRPVGVTAEVTAPMRRDLSAKLAKAFDAQGIASVTAPVATNRSRLVLSLLAAGVAEPDVIEIDVEQPDTVAAAIAQLDRGLSFLAPTLGLAAIDVADVAGPVVVAVDANGPAAKAGIQAGSVVATADGKPVADAAALNAAVAARTASAPLALEVKDAAGAQKRVELTVQMRPRLIGVNDQTLLVNRTLVALRARLADAPDGDEKAAIRLNLAAALTRLESWDEARTELQQVTLPDGPGIGTGTVQYLMGLCAARQGNRADAEAAFKQAAASTSLLGEDGPPVKELAEARLAELQRAAAR
jgi:membrane-associated protease RseP (regulator of RpoE activity)